jgi:hypothetical protein
MSLYRMLLRGGFGGLAGAAFLSCAIFGSQASAATIYALDDRNNLFTFDNLAPQNILSGVFLFGLQPNEHLLNIDFRPSTGDLYGIGSSYHVYTINPATGACTPLGGIGGTFPAVPGNSFGMDFNPAADRIRFYSDADNNIRLHPDTGGLVATDTNLTYKAGDSNFGVNPNVVGAAYTNSVSPAPTLTTLYGIDSNTNSLVRVGGVDGGAPEGSPNAGVLTTIGPLGVNADNFVGFDISANNIAFASLASGGNSSLYSIDLATGLATNQGQIIGGVRVVDIALQPGVTFTVPEPTTVVLAIVGMLTICWFRRSAA